MRALYSYRDEGFEAYDGGRTPDDCPYAQSGVRRFDWLAGWLEASGATLLSETASARSQSRKELLRTSLPGLSEVEASVGPTVSWIGNCHSVASQLLHSGLLAPLSPDFGEPRLCYGLFSGFVSPSSPFSGSLFPRHGWIEFDEGIVVDPTRWVFESTDPCLAVCGIEDYDLAARRMRSSLSGRKPSPYFDPTQRIIPWDLDDPATPAAAMLLGERSRLHEGKLSIGQAFWLGNLPLSELGSDAVLIYEAFDRLNLLALVPIDNRNYVDAKWHPPTP